MIYLDGVQDGQPTWTKGVLYTPPCPSRTCPGQNMDMSMLGKGVAK